MEKKILNGKIYFVQSISTEDALDVLALEMLQQNIIPGTLPFRLFHEDGREELRYEIKEGIPCRQWLEKKHDKKEVMSFLNSLILLEEELSYYLLDSVHVCVDFDFVMVKDHQCLVSYVPVCEYQRRGLLLFVRDVLSQLRHVQEDYTYVYDLINAIGAGNISSMEELRYWLRRMEEKKLPPETFQPHLHTQKMQGEIFREKEEATVVDTGDGKVKKGFRSFWKKEGRVEGKLNKESVQQTQPKEAESMKQLDYERPAEKIRFSEEEDLYEETGILSIKQEQSCLIRSATGKAYPLANGGMTIGSGQTADICISDNRAISRLHARIYPSGEGWCLEDLGSKNGTCVNDEPVRRGESFRIYPSDRIIFANEEFEFG